MTRGEFLPDAIEKPPSFRHWNAVGNWSPSSDAPWHMPLIGWMLPWRWWRVYMHTADYLLYWLWWHFGWWLDTQMWKVGLIVPVDEYGRKVRDFSATAEKTEEVAWSDISGDALDGSPSSQPVG